MRLRRLTVAIFIQAITARFLRVLAAGLLVVVGLWLLAYPFDQPVSAQENPEQSAVALLKFDGSIDGVTVRFVERGLATAHEQNVKLVVLMLDTPGGLLDATRDIVEAFLVSDIPIAVYVAPEGAQAASAGTFIGAAAHILALAPTTNIGAASVLNVDGSDLPDTLGLKASEDAAAFIRSIAEARGRNVLALEGTVLEAKAYSASEAIELNIADLIAKDYQALLEQLDGYEIDLGNETVALDLDGIDTITLSMTFLERLLGLVSDPNVAFLLVSLGATGVIVELWNPGLWIPGTLGVLFLILGWTGIGLLPFSWAGVGLIVLSFLLLYLESTAPGIGYFGVAGSICLIMGGFLVVGFFGNPGIPGDAPIVNRWLLVAIGSCIGLVVLWVAWELRKQTRMNLYKGPLASTNLAGATGTVSVRLSPSGEVFVNGEFWSGELESGAATSLEAGVNVRVVAVEGNRLKVRPGHLEPNKVDVPNVE